MAHPPPSKNLFFRDPYFSLSWPERLLVKAISGACYGVLTVAAALFLFSGVPRLFWGGVLLSLFLGDRLLQLLSKEEGITAEIVQRVRREEPLNTAPYFRWHARRFLESALRQKELRPEASLPFLLLDELSKIPEVRVGLSRLAIEENAFRKAVAEKLKGKKSASLELVRLQHTATLSFEEAIALGETAVSAGALFLGLLREAPEELEALFSLFNFSEEDFHNALIFGRLAKGLGRKMLTRIARAQGPRRRSHRIMNRAWTARPTYYLDSMGVDLTDRAREGVIGFLVGHAQEYRTLLNTLTREEKNNALLVGDEGVGKETVVGHLAHEIIRDEVPPKLFDKRLVQVNIPSLTAGAKTAGEIQERFKRLIEEVLLTGNIILYFPDIHALKLTSGEGLSAFEFLKPVFASSAIATIGSTNPKDFRNVIEKDQAFLELFNVIRVEEISGEEALRFLTYESYILEAKWKIFITYKALKQAVVLATRYLHAKPLPSSAVELLEEALADARARGAHALEEKDVVDLASRKSKIPIEIAKGREAEKLLELEKRIHERLINQEEAVNAVASALRQYRAGLAREKGPIATFLFIGPTGVGKTELSKALAEIYFGDEDEMVRFDMVEYQDPKSVWNFVGSPDGAISGNLTEAIKKKPFAVLLLDEFEKAHADILELFLPLFDEGRLTDSLGTVVDFTNTIIISTSNAHSTLIKEEIEKGTSIENIATLLKKRLTEYFKPELINRFDDIIVFRPLTEAEIQKIATLQLQTLSRRLREEQGIQLEVASEVSKVLAKLGWDPVFGARPLRGVIREKIRDVLASEILAGKISRGAKVRLHVKGDAFLFERR